MPKMQIPEKLLPLMQVPKRFKIVIGGRGSAKSMTIAKLLLMMAQTQGIKAGCFREYQNSIDDSVLSLLSTEIQTMGLKGFDPQQAKILYDGEDAFRFRGLARNPEGVKSAHGFKIFWVEEAQTISYASLRALTPTLREEGSEIWMSANLRSMADPFSQRFFKPFEKELRKNRYYEDDLHLIIWVNYPDNPFFPDVLEQERLYDKEHMSTAEYRHVWEGETYDEVANSIIPVEWFEAAIDAHIKLGFEAEGLKVVTHDPSDEGPDPKGYAYRHGVVFVDVREEKVGDVHDGLKWAMDRAGEAQADIFSWDCDGMGGVLTRDVEAKLKGKHMKPITFHGSGGVENPDDEFEELNERSELEQKTNRERLLNRRAQFAWRLRLRFYRTWRAVTKGVYSDPGDLISISSGIEQMDELRAQVCRVPRKKRPDGKFQVLSKVEMAKKPYELPSPNMFDCMLMSELIPPDEVPEDFNIEFQNWGT